MWSPNSTNRFPRNISKANLQHDERFGDNFGPETNDDSIEEIIEDTSKHKESELAPPIPRKISTDMKLELPSQPVHVNVVGYNECAIVWWKYTSDIMTVKCWDINVYVLNNGIWIFNTLIRVHDRICSNQYMVEDLENNQIYRFSVISRNLNGSSRESAFSPAVLVHEPLPAGWILFFEEDSRRFRYLHLKTREYSYIRPDANPNFIEETIRNLFRPAELRRLIQLFEEEMSRQGKITVSRMQKLLKQLGEQTVSRHLLAKAVREVSPESDAVFCLRAFMAVVYAVKFHALANSRWPHVSFGIRSIYYRSISVRNFLRRWVTTNKEIMKLVEHWELRWSETLNRPFYRHRCTKELLWDMPNEIRFYVSSKVMIQLLQVFSYRDIESLKTHFTSLDPEIRGWLSGSDAINLLTHTATTALAPMHVIEQPSFVKRRFHFESFCQLILSWLLHCDENLRITLRDKLLSQHLPALDISGRRRSSNQAENFSSDHSLSNGDNDDRGEDVELGLNDKSIRKGSTSTVGNGGVRSRGDSMLSKSGKEGLGLGSGKVGDGENYRLSSIKQLGNMIQRIQNQFLNHSSIQPNYNRSHSRSRSSIIRRLENGKKVKMTKSVIQLSVRAKENKQEQIGGNNVMMDELEYAHSNHCLCGCRIRKSSVLSMSNTSSHI